MMDKRPVLIMAGGTGGHVFPALTVAEKLINLGIPVIWLGTKSGLEAKIVSQAGIPIELIRITGLRGKKIVDLMCHIPLVLTAVIQALKILKKWQPRVVLGMGGFVSGPGGLAANLLRIPLVIHEQNAVPGLTNRILASTAVKILTAFPNTFPYKKIIKKTLLVGNPVRACITNLLPPLQRFANRTGRTRLLILGGSQGAAALNNLVPRALALLKYEELPEVWHQSGPKLLEETVIAYQAVSIQPKITAFIEDMHQAYSWADLVLCRAGAITISELAAAGIGSILVPFPFAVDNHQTYNAQFLEQTGAAYLCQQVILDATGLALLLRKLLSNRDLLLKMAEAARKMAKPAAADCVAMVCLEQLR